MCLGNVIKYSEKESDKDFSPYIVFFLFFFFIYTQKINIWPTQQQRIVSGLLKSI